MTYLIKYKVYAPNKTEYLDIHVFNMTTGQNESKNLYTYIYITSSTPTWIQNKTK